MSTPERPLSPNHDDLHTSVTELDTEKSHYQNMQTHPSSQGSDLEAGLISPPPKANTKHSSGVSRVFRSMRWKPLRSSALTTTEESAEDGEKQEALHDAQRTPEYTTEARNLVRSFTQKDLTVGYDQAKSGTDTPFLDKQVHDLDYVPAPEQYKPSVFGALLSSKLNSLHQEAHTAPRDFYYSFDKKHKRARSQDRASSGTSTPKVRWYDKPESNSVTNLLAQSALSTTSPGLPGTARALPRSRAPRPKSEGPEYFNNFTHHRGPSVDSNEELIGEVSDIIARRKYLTKLCAALMKYGAPTHRLEEYLSASARSLAIDADFMFIPGAMMCTFIDNSIYANNVELVRKSAGLDFGRLKDVFNVYKNVIHRKLTAQEGIQEIENIQNAPERYSDWFRIFLFGLASVVVGPFSFSTRPVDFGPIFIMGAVLGFALIKIVPKSEQFSNVFEVFACVIIAFVSRGLGSIQYGDGTYVFCFSGMAQSSIAMILPGFMVLNSALELQGKNIVSGSVRMVYSIIYVMFLGFGLLVGTTVFGLIKRDAVSEATCSVPEWFTPHGDYRLLYTTFIWAPLFACCLALAYGAKWRQLPVMTLIAVCGHQANYWISTQLSNNVQVANAIGAFVIGCLANLYSRLFHGLAAAAMLPAIYCQVPGGLAASGSLITSIDSANQIFGNSTAAAQSGSNDISESSIYNIGYGMVQVAIGISVGLYLSALVVYPFGKRRSGLFSF